MLKHSLSLLHTISFYEYTTVYLFSKDANLDHFQLFAPVNKVVYDHVVYEPPGAFVQEFLAYNS